jgi:hypothetical protein
MGWDQLLHDLLYELDFMQWALVAGVVFLGAILYRCQRADDDFDLRHLVASRHDGKIDRYAFVFVAGWFFLTWAFVYYAMGQKLSTVDFVAYGLLTMFPKVIEKVAGPIIQQRFGGAAPVPASNP